MNIFLTKKSTIIYFIILFFGFIFTIVFITFVAPRAQKKILSPLVIIDPGHGGEDGGAVGHDGIVEKDINLKISLIIRDALQLLGYETIMTREKDKAIYDESAINLRQKKRSDLRNRLSIIHKNSGEDSIFLSIHQNKFPNEKYSGSQIFFSKNNPLSESLALCIKDSIVSLLQPYNTREIKEATSKIFLLNNSKIPSVTLECGFLSNKDESQKLNDRIYQKKVALCTILGINDFFSNY